MRTPEVTQGECPAGALLLGCKNRGEWTDCYVATIGKRVSHADFVEAFYTSGLFKIERRILAWAIKKPSTDQEARELANGNRDQFAAWIVESRAPNQLLLTDVQGRTRSWLMTVPAAAQADSTLLYFGSAIVPRARRADPDVRNNSTIPGSYVLSKPVGVFGALLGFHDWYSRALLRAASRRLD